jgi:hypothetical protein
LCNRVDRASYLSLVSSPHFAVTHHLAGVKKTCNCDVLRAELMAWLVSRDVATTVLDVDAVLALHASERINYLNKHGKHVGSVYISANSATVDKYDSVIPELCEFCPDVKVFCCRARLGPVSKAHIAAKWTKLTHLTVSLHKVKESFAEIGDACQSLVELEIQSGYGNDFVEPWLRFFRDCSSILRSISSQQCFNEPTYLAIATRCSLLEQLEVPRDSLNDAALLALAQGCPRLRSLKLERSAVSDVGVIALGRNGALTSLSVQHCIDVSDAGLRAIAENCVNLERCKLNHLPQVTDATLLTLGLHCHHLKYVDITSLGVTANALKCLAEGCPRLEELCAWDCSQVGPGLEAVALNCPQLRVLRVAYTQVPAKAVRELAKYCTLLEQVSLSGEEIGDNEALLLTRSCKKLMILSITETPVTAPGVRAIALQCGPALRVVTVRNALDPFSMTNKEHITPPGVMTGHAYSVSMQRLRDWLLKRSRGRGK